VDVVDVLDVVVVVVMVLTVVDVADCVVDVAKYGYNYGRRCQVLVLIYLAGINYLATQVRTIQPSHRRANAAKICSLLKDILLYIGYVVHGHPNNI
jgi:hypothetical protein